MKDEQVEAAFSILSDELERVLIATHRDAKRCIDERQYDKILRHTEIAKFLLEFQEKIDSLESEWGAFGDTPKDKTKWQKQSPVTQSTFHGDCIKKAEAYFKTTFIKQSRSTFISTDRSIKLVCAVSKRYDRTSHNYWFSFHPYQGEFLSSAPRGFFLFGCGEDGRILLIPYQDLMQWVEKVNKSVREDGSYYYHVKFIEEKNRYFSILEGRNKKVDVSKYLLDTTKNKANQSAHTTA